MSELECRQTLEALLESVSGDLKSLRCLDITGAGFGGAWLEPRGLGKQGGDGKTAGRFEIVICDIDKLDHALAVLDTDGVVLVLTPQQNGEIDQRLQRPHLTVRASLRSRGGTWNLCAPTTNSSPEYEVSLIVTCQDQALALAQLLPALASMQDLPAWELLIVDRGSFDETGALLRALEGDIQIMRRPRDTDVSDAIDLALHSAKAPISLVLSPDLLPLENWLSDLLTYASQNPAFSSFSGNVEDESPEQQDSEFVEPNARIFAVRTDNYRRRGGMDPSLPLQDALNDLSRRVGGFVNIPGFRATRQDERSRESTGT